MIRFAMAKQKQTFYSCYLNKMPLNPEKFGLPFTNRIIIGEHLTLTNSKIFKTALQLKKDSKLAQVFTENGLVKARLKKGKHEATYTIRNVTELEILVAQNQQRTQTPSVELTQPQAHSSAPTANTPATQLNSSVHYTSPPQMQLTHEINNTENHTNTLTAATSSSTGNVNAQQQQQPFAIQSNTPNQTPLQPHLATDNNQTERLENLAAQTGNDQQIQNT